MKQIDASLGILVLGATIALSGCVHGGSPLVLDPVGPAMDNRTVPETNGSLVVFSAIDPTPHVSGLSYRIYYTDYKLLSEEGTLLQFVHNDNGTALEGPKRISLRPGKYCVAANASGYGRVTVPVLVMAHRTTTVHLEGGGASETGALGVHEEFVRFPDGRIIGSRAVNEGPHATAPHPSAVPLLPNEAIIGSHP